MEGSGAKGQAPQRKAPAKSRTWLYLAIIVIIIIIIVAVVLVYYHPSGGGGSGYSVMRSMIGASSIP